MGGDRGSFPYPRSRSYRGATELGQLGADAGDRGEAIGGIEAGDEWVGYAFAFDVVAVGEVGGLELEGGKGGIGGFLEK